jgi:hypothetical protein
MDQFIPLFKDSTVQTTLNQANLIPSAVKKLVARITQKMIKQQRGLHEKTVGRSTKQFISGVSVVLLGSRSSRSIRSKSLS